MNLGCKPFRKRLTNIGCDFLTYCRHVICIYIHFRLYGRLLSGIHSSHVPLPKSAPKSKSGNGSYTSILLRESFRRRQQGQIQNPRPSSPTCQLMSWPLSGALSPNLKTPWTTSRREAPQSLRTRTGPSLGALWTVDQVAQRLGIKKALGVTLEAELSYWQGPGSSLASKDFPLSHGALGKPPALRPPCWAGAGLSTRTISYANGSWLEGRHAVIERRLWGAAPDPAQRPVVPLRCDQQLSGRATITL